MGLLYRINCGHGDQKVFRYPDDLYDRIWTAGSFASMTNITRNESTVSTKGIVSEIPPAVMRTAITPRSDSKPIVISLDGNYKYILYIYWAELLELLPNQTRVFDFYVNDKLLRSDIRPEYLSADGSYLWKPIVAEQLQYNLSASYNSTLPPILNALEVYFVVDDSTFTEPADVDTLRIIKSSYNILENWEGDPCGPKGYPWKGVTCNYTSSETLAVVSLDLSSFQLRGQITRHLSSLKSLQVLDLSNNSLTGPVPGFLSQLSSLTFLNISENNFTGTIPDSLAARWKAGSLYLIATGNPSLCLVDKCFSETKTKGSRKSYLTLISVGVLPALVVAAAFALLFWKTRVKKHAGDTQGQGKGEIVALQSNSISLTYSNIVKITNNFTRVIGRGASGEVYFGIYSGTPVAVKMVSEHDQYQQFQTEANHLLKVHHRNLTKLVGYCNEETHLALVYEYMENGSLRDRLLDASKVLSWTQRTQIAMDSAQGLEYLHHHCATPIIHRDIKAANILLDSQLHAKISDFGLSRSSPSEQGSRHATMVVGTPGYLDPEYMTTGMLTMKSDVYSYGVVLLELITGRHNSEMRDESDTDLSFWVGERKNRGDIKSIVDPKLRGDFDASGAWIMVELAMDCTSPSSDSRPTMPSVLSRLKGCMHIEETEYFTDSYVPVGGSSPHLR